MPVEEILASEAHIRALAAYLRRHGVKLGQREAEVLVYLDLTQGRDPLDRIPPDRRDHASPGLAPHGDGEDHADRPRAADDPEPGHRDPQDEGQQDDEGWRDGPWDDWDD